MSDSITISSNNSLIVNEEDETTYLRPVLIRHQMSGVWVGYLLGPGTFDNSIEIEGRRIWSWQGGRLELSQVAVQGCKKEDRLGEWEVVEIGSISTQLIELRTIQRKVVQEARAFSADGNGDN